MQGGTSPIGSNLGLSVSLKDTLKMGTVVAEIRTTNPLIIDLWPNLLTGPQLPQKDLSAST